ncbi:hypothetical protein B0H10DRAFT_2216927 [Mycena sp. CBHHK59/15]|nr:hypothetical protein B0H10DRAFT_2216927 [Mycena sp. CBHHK59/15]
MDPTILKVPIIHNSNTAHNHPMPALTKASFELKAAYRKCIEAAGCVRATVSKVDNDWWDHKAMSAWILPSLVKSQSPMSTEDWDKTPSTTNTGEAQHHWTNSRTGIKLSLVEAIEMARKVDKEVVREIETSLKSGVLLNGQNEAYHRMACSSQHQSSVMCKAHKSNELYEERTRIESEIEAAKETRKQSAAQLKTLSAELKSVKESSSKTRKSLKATPRTVITSASSSGRVKTRTIRLNASTLNLTPTAVNSPPPPMASLPVSSPPSSIHDLVTVPAIQPKKRRARDEVDEANIVDGTRAWKRPKPVDSKV